eukprot:m.1301954 g.1301954  ORF g.1301954 m.1301954 type:complete len:201 (-) comp24807_c1_seq6:2600-3202(-)
MVSVYCTRATHVTLLWSVRLVTSCSAQCRQGRQRCARSTGFAPDVIAFVAQRLLELYEHSPRLSSGRIEDANKAELLQLVEKLYAEISAHNESKALLTVLVTPITLGSLAFACNILSTFVSVVGLDSLAILLSYITWMCLLAIALWGYSTNTGNFSEIALEIDNMSKMIFKTAKTAFQAYMTGVPLSAALDAANTKKKTQ